MGCAYLNKAEHALATAIEAGTCMPVSMGGVERLGAREVEVFRMNADEPALDWVAEEVPVALVYNGISHAVMMASPSMLEEFALGFSLAEGIIPDASHLYACEVREACRGGIEVDLTISSECFWKLKDRRRSMTGRTGCGICGVESLGEAVREKRVVPHEQTFPMAAYADALGYLERVERLGGIRHLGGQLIDDILAMARQKTFDTFDVLGIVRRRNRADTRTRAAPDMVVKAGTPVLRANHIDDVFLAPVGLDDTTTTTPLRTGCGADGDNLAQRIYRLTCRTAIGIGTKITRSRLMTLARIFDSGIQVALCNGDKGVALVILEVDVKVRMVLTNQIALEHQRLVLGLHHDIVKARHQLHHQRDLLTLILQCHVLAHTGTQVFCLAHVDDIALGILPKVASGLCGNARNLLGKRWNVVVTGHTHLLATKQRRDLRHLKDDGKAKSHSERDDACNTNVAQGNEDRAAKHSDKVLKCPHDAGARGSAQATEQQAEETAMQDTLDLKAMQTTAQPPQ